MSGRPLALTLPRVLSVLVSKTVALEVAAVTGHAAAEVGDEGDSMYARSVGDFANGFFAVDVNNDDAGSPRDIQSPIRGIDFDEVPASLAAECDFAPRRTGPWHLAPGHEGRVSTTVRPTTTSVNLSIAGILRVEY